MNNARCSFASFITSHGYRSWWCWAARTSVAAMRCKCHVSSLTSHHIISFITGDPHLCCWCCWPVLASKWSQSNVWFIYIISTVRWEMSRTPASTLLSRHRMFNPAWCLSVVDPASSGRENALKTRTCLHRTVFLLNELGVYNTGCGVIK